MLVSVLTDAQMDGDTLEIFVDHGLDVGDNAVIIGDGWY